MNNSDRQQRIQAILLAARDLEGTARIAFVDEQCGDDALLRAEVRALLDHYDPSPSHSRFASGDDLENARTDLFEIEDVAVERAASPTSTDQEEFLSSGGTPRGDSPPTRRSSEFGNGRGMPGEAFPGDDPGLFERRFMTGEVLAGRYRIEQALGAGGMGHVYRAFDLRLGQTVALKFLDEEHASDVVRLSHFRDEVRLARRVTHPNVNRVYDLVEDRGIVFISMELVDGEDLASLLRRIRRLSGDKAIEIARQLCLGLGAAHEQGVLHRDLKPGNIMLDRQGFVQITDFGIATLLAEVGSTTRVVGTPSYMAPELFHGKEASVQSDLYALGVVLYELATGRSPFDDASGNGRHRGAPRLPSTLVSDIESELELQIIHCLDPDPKRRPSSAYAVASVLPGGDALSETLVTGKTPPPELTAAKSARPAAGVRSTIALLAGALAALVLVVLLAEKTFLVQRARMTVPPMELDRRAADLLDELGAASVPSRRTSSFLIDRAYLGHLRGGGDEHARPSMVYFLYREDERRFVPETPFTDRARMRDMPLSDGMRSVELDPDGRLRRIIVAPDADESHASAPISPVEWSELFDMAGFEFARFQPIDPARSPPVFAETRFAWSALCADGSGEGARVEAATRHGRVVYFDVIEPWRAKSSPSEGSDARGATVTQAIAISLFVAAIVGGLLLVRRNVRFGRGHPRAAKRLAVYVIVVGVVDWLLGQRHVAEFSEEMAVIYTNLALIVFRGACVCVFYMAAEPYVREMWPRSIVSWSRLLDGQWRDRQVGRDILAGGLVGSVCVLLIQLEAWLPLGASRVPIPNLMGVDLDLGTMLGLRHKLDVVTESLLSAIMFSITVLLFMLLFRVVLRVERLSGVAFGVSLAVGIATGGDSVSLRSFAFALVLAIAFVAVMKRIGLLAVVTGVFFALMLMNSPITFRDGVWYAPMGEWTLTVLFAVLVYAALASTGGGRSPRRMDETNFAARRTRTRPSFDI